MKNYFADNIFGNPGFETGKLEPWLAFGDGEVSIDATIRHTGKYSCRLRTFFPNKEVGIKQGIFFVSQYQPFQVSYYAYSETANTEFVTQLASVDEKENIISSASYTDIIPILQWKRIFRQFFAVGTSCFYILMLTVRNPTSSFVAYLDNVHAFAIPQIRLDSEYRIETHRSKKFAYMDQNDIELTTDFQPIVFDTIYSVIVLQNRAQNSYIDIGFGSATVHARVFPQQIREFQNVVVDTVWLRGQNGGEEYCLEVRD
jgi:hypothetical protein